MASTTLLESSTGAIHKLCHSSGSLSLPSLLHFLECQRSKMRPLWHSVPCLHLLFEEEKWQILVHRISRPCQTCSVKPHGGFCTAVLIAFTRECFRTHEARWEDFVAFYKNAPATNARIQTRSPPGMEI
jgi:hypothetical protein